MGRGVSCFFIGCMERKLFICIGKCSLSIYLWHFPIQCFIRIIDTAFKIEINYSSRRFFLLYAVSVLIMAELSRYYIEQKRIDIWRLLKRMLFVPINELDDESAEKLFVQKK